MWFTFAPRYQFFVPRSCLSTRDDKPETSWLMNNDSRCLKVAHVIPEGSRSEFNGDRAMVSGEGDRWIDRAVGCVTRNRRISEYSKARCLQPTRSCLSRDFIHPGECLRSTIFILRTAVAASRVALLKREIPWVVCSAGRARGVGHWKKWRAGDAQRFERLRFPGIQRRRAETIAEARILESRSALTADREKKFPRRFPARAPPRGSPISPGGSRGQKLARSREISGSRDSARLDSRQRWKARYMGHRLAPELVYVVSFSWRYVRGARW